MTRLGGMGPKRPNFDQKMAKTAKTGFFNKNPKLSLPYPYNDATFCKKLEKNHERILRSRSDGRIVGRTDARTDGGKFIGHISASGTN